MKIIHVAALPLLIPFFSLNAAESLKESAQNKEASKMTNKHSNEKAEKREQDREAREDRRRMLEDRFMKTSTFLTMAKKTEYLIALGEERKHEEDNPQDEEDVVSDPMDLDSDEDIFSLLEGTDK